MIYQSLSNSLKGASQKEIGGLKRENPRIYVIMALRWGQSGKGWSAMPFILYRVVKDFDPIMFEANQEKHAEFVQFVF